jgi:hypothetical protein
MRRLVCAEKEKSGAVAGGAGSFNGQVFSDAVLDTGNLFTLPWLERA